VIDEANKNGLRVAAHIYDLHDANAILGAGINVIAHGVRDRPVDSECLDMMKARSVWYIATIVLDYGITGGALVTARQSRCDRTKSARSRRSISPTIFGARQQRMARSSCMERER
jgi:hypothetical protein